MSNKTRDSYTPIHNYVLEALMRIHITPSEVRVLFAVWRKTYGFYDRTTGQQKKYDYISLSQFEDMTGLTRQGVMKALRGLLKKQIITREDSKTAFSKEFMKKKSLIKKIEVGNKTTLPIRPVPATGMVSMAQILKEQMPW